MVLHHDFVVSLRVVIAAVVIFFLFTLLLRLSVLRAITTGVALVLADGWTLCLNFLDTLAEEVDLWEVKNLCLLIIGEVPRPELLQALGRRHGDFHLLTIHGVTLCRGLALHLDFCGR